MADEKNDVRLDLLLELLASEEFDFDPEDLQALSRLLLGRSEKGGISSDVLLSSVVAGIVASRTIGRGDATAARLSDIARVPEQHAVPNLGPGAFRPWAPQAGPEGAAPKGPVNPIAPFVPGFGPRGPQSPEGSPKGPSAPIGPKNPAAPWGPDIHPHGPVSPEGENPKGPSAPIGPANPAAPWGPDIHPHGPVSPEGENPKGPSAPIGPANPAAPWGPDIHPHGPVSPEGENPKGPSAPIGPANPAAPVGPAIDPHGPHPWGPHADPKDPKGPQPLPPGPPKDPKGPQPLPPGPPKDPKGPQPLPPGPSVDPKGPQPLPPGPPKDPKGPQPLPPGPPKDPKGPQPLPPGPSVDPKGPQPLPPGPPKDPKGPQPLHPIGPQGPGGIHINPGTIFEVVTFEEFLTPADLKMVTDYALDNEPHFRPSSVVPPHNRDGVIDPAHRRSRLVDHPGEVEALFRDNVHRILPEVARRLGMASAQFDAIDVQITATNDGEFFVAHQDNGGDHFHSRQLSYVYFFHREPTPFTGGELQIHEPEESAKANGAAPRYQTITPRRNGIVFFPSGLMHEIRPVSCPSQAFMDSRFTVNGWIHVKGDLNG